jgi:trigger factor
MNITRENIDELNAILTVSIEQTDYEATVNDVLKNYRKKANMPGFRPGMVPAGLIKKMYGKSALAEEVNKILSKSLTDYIHAEKLNVLGEPLPNEEKQPAIDWDNQTGFSFVFDIAMAQEFEVSLDESTKIKYYEILANDEMVNKQMDAYLSRLGQNLPVEQVEENDTVRGTFVQLNDQGEILENGIVAKSVVIAIDLMKDAEIKASFIGKGKSDLIVFDPLKAYENKHEVGHMLNISHEEAENISGNFNFTIEEVLRFEKPTPNPELFAKIFGEDSGIVTMEDFTAKIKSELENSFLYSSDYKFGLDSRDAFIEKIKFDLPEAFLKRWILATNENMTSDQLDADFGSFMLDLRWQLIKEKIRKNYEVQITDNDVRTLAKETALNQFRQYGMYDVADEHLERYADQILKKEEDRRNLVNKALENAILATIKSKVKIELAPIGYDDFGKLLEN